MCEEKEKEMERKAVCVKKKRKVKTLFSSQDTSYNKHKHSTVL